MRRIVSESLVAARARRILLLLFGIVLMAPIRTPMTTSRLHRRSSATNAPPQCAADGGCFVSPAGPARSSPFRSWCVTVSEENTRIVAAGRVGRRCRTTDAVI